MGAASILILAGVLVSAGASFFFALAESALFALGKWRARQLAEATPQRGGAVLGLLEHPEELLATLALGNTVANGLLVALALWPEFTGLWPAAITLPLAFLLILVGCEVLPKTLAVRSPEAWALRVALPMKVIQGVTGWFQNLVQYFNRRVLQLLIPKSVKPQAALTGEDYQELLDLAFHQGALAGGEKEIILQIISLDLKTAGDVMRPRSTMAAIPDDLTLEEMLREARRFRHRRLPMYDETPDNVVGVLNARALLMDPAMDLADAIEFPSFVPESMNLLQLLKSLQRQRRGLAIVLDEFGGTAGVIRVEDILGEVVGEFRGGAGNASEGFVIEKLGPGRWRVNGTMWLDDFRREVPGLPHAPGVETMGGWMVARMEVVPEAGESVVIGGLKLTAQAVTDRCVRELLVEELR